MLLYVLFVFGKFLTIRISLNAAICFLQFKFALRSVKACTHTLAIEYNLSWIMHALRQNDYFKTFPLPNVLRTLFKMIPTSTFRIKWVSHFIIFLLFKCFPRLLSLRKKRHPHFNTTDVAVCVFVLLHL